MRKAIVSGIPNPETMSEDTFQRAVIALAVQFGWRVHAERKAQIRADAGGKKKFVTPIQGHKGYPDLTLAHPRCAPIFWELKSETGRVDPEQTLWLDLLGGTVRRPRDWPRIVEILSFGEAYVADGGGRQR